MEVPLHFDSGFKPAWWCSNPHLQTLWPYFFRQAPHPRYRRQRFELDDGDFLDIDWFGPKPPAPIVVVLHGLGGNSNSHYVRGLVATLANSGMRSAVVHHRGCSGEPNRLARSYHAGDGEDLGSVLLWLSELEPRTQLFAAGYSLGASMLLNRLRRNGKPLTAAAAVSTPLLLAAGAERMERGLSRMYQRGLVAQMKQLIRQKATNIAMPVDPTALHSVRTFRQFDNLVTAPLHGFRDVEDYYSRCSTRSILTDITTPTLMVHAADDPLMTPEVIPRADELSPAITFRLCRHGGHCGFIGGRWPHRIDYWAERTIVQYFRSFILDCGTLATPNKLLSG